MTLQNDTLIRALLRQPVDYTPVWIMRQAGRYLPEYRATRAAAGDFLSLMKNPELACEVTLQPLKRFNLDAAILFSDILTIPDAMGLGLHFVAGEGPKFASPIQTVNDIARLGKPDPETDLRYVCDAVRSIKAEIQNKLPLIGFAGSPWTIACYMVEGGSSKEFSKIKSLIYNDPEHGHQLLQKLSDAIADYLNAQIAAGVDVVMLFDTWGGILTRRDYELFSLQYMSKIIAKLNRNQTRRIPVILFTKNSGQWLETIAASGCDAVGLDWTIDIGTARQRVGEQVALQGNMDPSMLYANPERIRAEVATILQHYGTGSGHVFNLGHGITPGVNPEHLAVCIDAVHEFSRQHHTDNNVVV